jgi:hypothetical protein
MSTEAPTRPRIGPGLRLTSLEVVLIRRLGLEVWKTTRWFWLAATVVTVLVGAVIAHFTPITSSIWENAGQWPRWWLFAMAVALIAVQLPVAVTHGVTRRAALRAVGVVSVLVSLFWAGYMVLGHVVERIIYDALGWPDAMQTEHLFTDGYDVLPMLAEYWLIFLGYLVAGLLVGGVYYRFGPVRGTLLLPATLLPAVVIEVLLSTGWYGTGLQDGLSIDRSAAPVLVVASVVVLSLGALAIYLVLRDVPIHGKK